MEEACCVDLDGTTDSDSTITSSPIYSQRCQAQNQPEDQICIIHVDNDTSTEHVVTSKSRDRVKESGE